MVTTINCELERNTLAQSHKVSLKWQICKRAKKSFGFQFKLSHRLNCKLTDKWPKDVFS